MLVTDALEIIPLSSKLRLHKRPAIVHSLKSTLRRSFFVFSEFSLEPFVCSMSGAAGCLDTNESVSAAMMMPVAAVFRPTPRVQS